MKNPATAFTNALAVARDTGIVPRKFVYFKAKKRSDGTAVEIGYWSGDEDITTSLVDGNGNTVSRTYFGNGELKKVDPIVYVSDLTIQTTSVTMSKIAPNVLTLLNTYDPRLAEVEIHDGLLSSPSALVSPPELALWGLVDGAPRSVPGVGGESSVILRIVPAGIRQLTRINPAKRSYESQKRRRSGDEFYLYANSAITWQRNWGQNSTSTTAKK